MTTDPRQCNLCRIAYDSEGKPLRFIRAQHRVQEVAGGERVCVLSIGQESSVQQEMAA